MLKALELGMHRYISAPILRPCTIKVLGYLNPIPLVMNFQYTRHQHIFNLYIIYTCLFIFIIHNIFIYYALGLVVE